MSVLGIYEDKARSMNIVLPSEFVQVLQLDECLQTLSDHGMDFLWESPEPISEMCDLVFQPGPLGGSDRILLISGESDLPYGLDYRHSSDKPGLLIWEGRDLEHQGDSIAIWLYNQAKRVQEWIDDDDLCGDEQTRHAAERLRDFLLGFRADAKRDAAKGIAYSVEDAVGELITEYTYRHWTQAYRNIAVVGLGHYRYPTIKDLIQVGSAVRLIAEPENPYDSHAMAVEVEVQDQGYQKIGYISRGENANISYDMSYGFEPVGSITSIDGNRVSLKLTHALPADQTIGKIQYFENQHDHFKFVLGDHKPW